MSWYSNTALIHAAVGTVALTTFWIAGMAKKGSTVHKAAGKIYLLAMTGIILSAFPMVIHILKNEDRAVGAFLLYLLVITGTSIWCSWRAIRDKKDWQRYTGLVYKSLMVLNLLSSMAIAWIALMWPNNMAIILLAFSSIGLINGVHMFRFARAAPADSRWWMKEHLTAMVGNGVATHIAFLSIGLPKALPMLSGPVMQNVAWLGPLTLSIVAGIYLKRKYVPQRA